MASMSLARIRTAWQIVRGDPNPVRALTIRENKVTALVPVIPTPSHVVSVYEEDVRDTRTFTMEGEVTDWSCQPGTSVARLSVQDFGMNAVMQGSGQTNINLSIPVDVANYVPPRSRLRITVEVL